MKQLKNLRFTIIQFFRYLIYLYEQKYRWHSRYIECEIPDSYNEKTGKSKYEYLTFDEATEAGYCAGCGSFWAGVTSFDFSDIEGYCENCVDEIKSNDATFDEEDNWSLDDYLQGGYHGC
jgi:hypothetical protein